jgi:hypothetical protein
MLLLVSVLLVLVLVVVVVLMSQAVEDRVTSTMLLPPS